MKLFLFCCLLFLAVSPVFLFPTAEEDGETAVTSATTESDLLDLDEDDDEEIVTEQQPAVGEVAETSDTQAKNETIQRVSKSEKKNKNKRRRPNKRPKNNRLNQLHKGQKSSKRGKTRPANGKKGQAKTKTSKYIEYQPRSSETDKINKAVDDMLILFSQSLANGSSSMTNLKLALVPDNLIVQPWSYLALKNTQNKTESLKGTATVLRRKRDTAAIDETETDDNRNDEEDVSLTTDQDEKKSSTTPEIDNDDEGGDDDDEEMENTGANSTSDNRFYLTGKPSPVTQPDGSVEYNLQVIIEEGFSTRNLSKYSAEELRAVRKQSKQQSKQIKYRYPRKSNARVEGLELIKRSDDVLIGSKSNKTIFEVRLQIGPIKFVVKDSNWKDLPFPQSRVTSPILFTRLRLTEEDGKLVSARFKPTKIQVNETVVTIRMPEEKNALLSVEDSNKLATTVTHLSQEMVRAWNSGYLLKRVKRQFKQLFVTKIKNKERNSYEEEAKRLAGALAAHADTE